MNRLGTDILVIGCGAAGMACAAAAARLGVSVIAVDEREAPGGVLSQCVHKGFGLGRYGRDMTGREYGEEEAGHFRDSGAVYMPHSRVLELRAGGRTAEEPLQTDAEVRSSLQCRGSALVSGAEGMCEITFRECVLATGCMERPVWSLPVSGTRPEGVYTAGEAQEMIELGGCDAGDNVFILGSGDIGQIMARRFCQLGKTVIGMAEINDHLGGMKRNQEQCIEAYSIPVMLKTTVTEIHGLGHLTGVTVHHFDTDTDEYIECDTLISSLGLVPDRSLAEDLRVTGVTGDGSLCSVTGDGSLSQYPAWLHFCGNADYVHEIADSASAQGEKLGRALAERLLEKDV